MLSDEEKQAIDIIKNEIKAFETVITAMEKEIDDKDCLRKNILEIKGDILVRKTLVNLIEKQSKEIEEYKKQLDLDYVDKHFVPIERYNQLKKEIEELKEENEKYKNPPFFDEENYTSNDKIKAILEEYKYTEIGDSEKIIEFYKKMQSLLEKE